MLNNYTCKYIKNFLKNGLFLGGIIILLSGCGEKVLICGKEFSQGEKLPLKYDELNQDFIKNLEYHTKGDPNDLEYVKKKFSPASSDLFRAASLWSTAGLGSNGQKIYVKDIGVIKTLQTSIRWKRFEKGSGLCEFMK